MSLIRYCVELQDKFNKNLNENWINERTHTDWALTILAEGAEFIESLDWKWWKKTEVDYDNLKLEAVDLLHFIISGILKIIKDVDNASSYLENTLSIDKGDLPHMQKYIGEIQVIAVELDSIDLDNDNNGYARIYYEVTQRKLLDKYINLLKVVTYIAGFKSIEELFKLYIFKNALNRLRQNYGYKQGTYKKLWDGKHEDNYFMMKFSKENDVDSIDIAYKLLEDAYLSYTKEDINE